jgi:hypothetical protein
MGRQQKPSRGKSEVTICFDCGEKGHYKDDARRCKKYDVKKAQKRKEGRERKKAKPRMRRIVQETVRVVQGAWRARPAILSEAAQLAGAIEAMRQSIKQIQLEMQSLVFQVAKKKITTLRGKRQSREDGGNWTIEGLKQELRERGLQVGGSKKVLTDRLAVAGQVDEDAKENMQELNAQEREISRVDIDKREKEEIEMKRQKEEITTTECLMCQKVAKLKMVLVGFSGGRRHEQCFYTCLRCMHGCEVEIHEQADVGELITLFPCRREEEEEEEE